jgi:malonate decarboxylase delta subunit
MQTLSFSFAGDKPAPAFTPQLIGVVASGNLEVLLEHDPDTGGQCSFSIQTSALGFDVIWNAVVEDFHQRHGLANVRFSIHDMGATPAVVSLRLDQAAATLQEGES